MKNINFKLNLFVNYLTIPLIFFSLSNIEIKAQTTGGSAVPFLLIAPSARYGGMGEMGTAIADDEHSTHYNIAGLAYQNHTKVGLSYSKWLPQFNADLHYGYLTGCTYMPSLGGTLSGEFTYLDLGEFQRTFENGALGEKFRSVEYALAVGFATKLSDEFGAGIQGRFINSMLSSIGVGQEKQSGSGASVGFDLGVLWNPNLKIDGFPEKPLKVGATFTNIGPKIFYIDIAQADPLPTTLRTGIAFHLLQDEFNDMTIGADITKLLVNRPSKDLVDPVPKSLWTSWGNGKGVELSLGAEYWYEKLVALRAGYFTESAAGGNRKFLTFGAGLRYDIYGIDFSYINTIETAHPLANTLRFTLGIDLDKNDTPNVPN
ncbi:MAG: type IX secretion system outer membrane channel protein PorV [Chlorobiota bacterium]|nr:type IX secretion system outer membrane channel protein PorV [Chlorobiota bacterium]QQS67448.1 MAG: type IX secretion system outer membrane channel protein PorV [Chlorobiota bacterium]